MNFDFALNPLFVYLYCSAIALFGLLSVFFLGWQAGRLGNVLRKLKKHLPPVVNEEEAPRTGSDDTDVANAAIAVRKTHLRTGFVKGFEQYNRLLERFLGLKWKDFVVTWTEFVDTLILPEPGSDDPIRNTAEVSRYLNDDTVIFPNVSFGFYRAVPNLLTGVGILGTFFGLAAGVGSASVGLSSNIPDEITASLKSLLGGAALAFWTSIVGVSASILFLIVERIVTRRLHLKLNDWVREIESRLERVTPEEVALKQLTQAKESNRQLVKFNTELILSIEQALDEGIAKRLFPQIANLLEIMEGIRADRSTDAGQMIEKVLGQFVAAMQERTGAQFDELSGVIDTLNRSLEESVMKQGQMQDNIQRDLQSILDTIKNSMEVGTTSMMDTLNRSAIEITGVIADASDNMATQFTISATRFTDQMRAAANEMTTAGTDATRRISRLFVQIESAVNGLEHSIRRNALTLSEMTKFIEQVNTLRGTIESTHQRLAAITEPLTGTAREIRRSGDRIAELLGHVQQASEHMSTSISTMERHQKLVVSTWHRYQERFEDIDASLAKVFGLIDEGLSGYCDRVKDFANELDRTTSNTIRDL